MPKSVLPQPALPQISVGRPLGRPPPVISSRPAIPDAHFSNDRCPASRTFMVASSHVDSKVRPIVPSRSVAAQGAECPRGKAYIRHTRGFDPERPSSR